MQQNLAGLVRYWAAYRPDHVAVHFEGRDTPWRELDARSTALADGFVRSGVRSGDGIGILMGNRPELIGATGSAAIAMYCNVAEKDSVRFAIAAVVEYHGRIALLHKNTEVLLGVEDGSDGLLEDLDRATWRRTPRRDPDRSLPLHQVRDAAPTGPAWLRRLFRIGCPAH
ncbi:AMP-binding protein [Rhodococcus sp. NPDC059968]|uniref:AMP-binding protein n=1 Tax=Rhodococcus sp. NPDC059968 TaxID=3347017 RepID=UPI003670B397